MGVPEPQSTKIQTICVIGAGPVGLGALKTILDAPQYKSGQWKPTVFEARDDIGGIWLPAPPTGDTSLTALYDTLTTNVPHPVMSYSSFPFPPSTPLYPTASVVIKYLNDFADHFHLRPYIQFNTAVKSVVWDSTRWEVTTSAGTVLPFDLVLVCNGHYRKPRYPDTPGLSKWLSTGRASHSISYRRPDNFGDTVLVIGSGPSGQDIAAEMRTVTRTVIHSITGAIKEDVENLKRRGRVAHFGDNGEVTFEDGTVESGITHCILAIGYEFSFPFFSEDVVRSAVLPPFPPLPREIYNSTYNVFPLARHMFPLDTAKFPPSRLAFLGLLIYVAPFPLVEIQTRAALHEFTTPGSLVPSQKVVDIMQRYEDVKKQVGDEPQAVANAWHRFEIMQQFEYRDALFDFCSTASGWKPNAVWDRGPDAVKSQYTRVPEWEKEMYIKKDSLRRAWRRVEELGQADVWLKGVGNGGIHEWAKMTEALEKWMEAEDMKEGKP